MTRFFTEHHLVTAQLVGLCIIQRECVEMSFPRLKLLLCREVQRQGHISGQIEGYAILLTVEGHEYVLQADFITGSFIHDVVMKEVDVHQVGFLWLNGKWKTYHEENGALLGCAVHVLHAAVTLRYVLAVLQKGGIGKNALIADVGEKHQCSHTDREVGTVEEKKQFISRKIPTVKR